MQKNQNVLPLLKKTTDFNVSYKYVGSQIWLGSA